MDQGPFLAPLKQDAMDEEDPMMSTYDPRLVELDQDKKPIGLTKEAAKRLLVLLGFLNL